MGYCVRYFGSFMYILYPVTKCWAVHLNIYTNKKQWHAFILTIVFIEYLGCTWRVVVWDIMKQECYLVILSQAVSWKYINEVCSVLLIFSSLHRSIFYLPYCLLLCIHFMYLSIEMWQNLAKIPEDLRSMGNPNHIWKLITLCSFQATFECVSFKKIHL